MSIKARIETALGGGDLQYDIDEDGDFYISASLDIPVWISVTSDELYIKIFTYADVKNSTDKLEIFNLVSKISFNYYPNSIAYFQERLWAFYYLTINLDDFDKRLIEQIYICSRNFVLAVRELDFENVVW